MQMGEAMREDRKQAGYSIRELAEKLDMSPVHLNRIEKGERLMDFEKLTLFCDICHVPITKYLALYGDEKKAR